MKQKTSWVILFFLLFSIFSPMFITIDTDTIVVADSGEQVWENEYGRLSVYPATSEEILIQKQLCNITWYYPDNSIDVAFRFNDSLEAGRIQYNNGNNWVNVNMEHTTYNDKHYYVHKNFNVIQDQTYNIRWYYQVPLGSSGKWDLLAKLSSDTWTEAYSSGRYILLDPNWLSNWVNRTIYHIESDYVSADVYNVPIPITVNATVASLSNGGDSLRFTADDNSTLFNYEIERWNPSGDSIVWVNLTHINDTADTYFSMYYNNPYCIPGENIPGTWDTDYAAVFHFNDTDFYDSIWTFNYSSKTGNPTIVTGKVGNGIDFPGTADNNLQFATPIADEEYVVTANCWWEADGLGTDNDIFGQGSGNFLISQDTNRVRSANSAGAGFSIIGNTIPDIWTSFNHMIIRRDNIGYGTWWVNGTNETSSFNPGQNNELQCSYIGDFSSNHEADGILDELWVSYTLRSDAWCEVIYHSQNGTTGFLTPNATVYEGYPANEEPPSWFYANTSAGDRITLEWDTGENCTHTHIQRLTTGYPTTPSSGTTICTTTEEYFNDDTVIDGLVYYYSAWGYNTTSELYSSTYITNLNMTRPGNPTNIIAYYNSTGNLLNFTWTKGLGADNTMIRYRSDSTYPSGTSDGTLLVNTSVTGHDDSTFNSDRRYRTWSYNDTLNIWSTGININWGAITIRVFDENTSLPINNWDIFVSNSDKTSTYESIGNNNPLTIDMSVLPYGTNTMIRINATWYDFEIYYMDLAANNYYTLDAYLSTSNDTEFYIIRIINENEVPISGAKVTVMKYINDTVGYENVAIVLTGGNGFCPAISLIPNEDYAVKIEATGYTTAIYDLHPIPITYVEDRYHTFRLTLDIPSVDYDVFWDNITYTAEIIDAGYMQLGNISIVYNDINSSTIDTQIRLFEAWATGDTLINVDNRTSNSFNYLVTNINTTRTHYAVLYFNNTASFDITSPVVITMLPLHTYTNRTRFDIDTRVESVWGPAPIGTWGLAISIIIPIIILVSFGVFNTGIGILGCGISLGLMQGIYSSVLTTAFNPGLIVLAPIIIIIGVLYMWTKGKGDDHL